MTEELLVADRRDPLHAPCDKPVWWTTANAAEAFTGVPTPLTWTFCGPEMEQFGRDAFCAIGALTRAERPTPAEIEGRYIGIFWGRVAINVDRIRALGDRMPGTGGSAADAKILGGEEEGAGSGRNISRYPFVAVKGPWAAVRCRPTLLRLARETEDWWAASTKVALRDRAQMLAVLHEARRRFSRVGRPHTVATFVALFFYQRIGALAAAAGRPGLEATLLTGTGKEGTRSVTDLWEVSRDRMALEDFLARHGFNGSWAQELSDRVWREDDRAVLALLESYRSMDDEASPAAMQARLGADRVTAAQELLGSLSGVRKGFGRFLLRWGPEYVTLRDLGRNTFLKAVDVARRAARALGEDFVREGLLDDPDDVFYLSLEELDPVPDNARELVAFRRARRGEYEQHELPERWQGPVQAIRIAAPDDQGTSGVLEGMGVSAGVVEGSARVVLDPGVEDIEPGEILVCHTTDPSWASYFFVAAGVVIDIGGPLSHGAIVARELGIPCVISVLGATRRLRTGDRIRVDGNAGTVAILPSE